jgi:hypothetical protein
MAVNVMLMRRKACLCLLISFFLQLSRGRAFVSACFVAWGKCLQQRRFHSLSSAAEAVQKHMLSVDSMFNSQMSAVSAERDKLQTELLAEQDKVPKKQTLSSAEPKHIAYIVMCLTTG